MIVQEYGPSAKLVEAWEASIENWLLLASNATTEGNTAFPYSYTVTVTIVKSE